jgi:hypothetical protein
MGAFLAPRVVSYPAQAIVSAIDHAISRSGAVALPFTVDDVVRYFSSALGTEPLASGKAVVFTSGASGIDADLYRIEVAREARAVVVSFRGGGDYGMTMAREFFEAPFFEREETLRFFSMLAAADAATTARLKRFTVRMQLVQHRDDFHLTMRFTPPRS